MRKFLAIATALTICIGTSVTCFADESKLGILTMLGISEEELNENLSKSINDSPFSTYKYYASYNDLITALDDGSVDAIELDEYSAEYLLSHRDGYARYIPKDSKECQINYCLMFRETEDLLRDMASDEIQNMKVDGTLKKFRNDYLNNAIEGNELEITDFSQSALGDENIKVTLTGDLPPIDSLSNDGVPVGFNTAVMTELGNRLGWNISYVPTNAETRAFSVSSNDSDVVFWTRVIKQDDATPIEYDQPEGMILSKPYLVGTLCYIVKENSPLLNEK